MTRMAKAIRSGIAATALAAGLMATSGAQAAPGDYCQYVDAAVYCGVEENLYPGSYGYSDCVRRWQRAAMDC